VTNVLMVTTTMRMLDGVHRNTSNSGPLELLGVVLEVSIVSFQEGLVGSLATSDDADHASAGALDGSADARWKSDTGLLAILRVADDDGGAAGRAGKSATVSLLALEVGDDGTLGHLADGKDITNRESRCLLIKFKEAREKNNLPFEPA
jgi:hypothetical protein